MAQVLLQAMKLIVRAVAAEDLAGGRSLDARAGAIAQRRSSRNDERDQRGRPLAGDDGPLAYPDRSATACSPLGLCRTSYSTVCPWLKARKPASETAEWCTKTSWPSSPRMKP